MLQIKNASFQILPDQKIIKASEYAALIEGDQIIQQAQQQAQAIVARAQDAFEEEKKKGYQNGLAEGRRKIAETMMDSMTRSIRYFESVEQKVADLVIQSVRKILGKFDDQELTLRVVHNALELFRTQKQITVHVAPDQRDSMRQQVDALLKDFPSINVIEITADPRLQPGDCTLETEIGVVDCSLEVQLEVLQQSFTKAFNEEKESSDLSD